MVNSEAQTSFSECIPIAHCVGASDHFDNTTDGICPASPERRRPSASSRTHSDGPVSQTLLTSDFKRRELLRAVTLDDSQTPMKNW